MPASLALLRASLISSTFKVMFFANQSAHDLLVQIHLMVLRCLRNQIISNAILTYKHHLQTFRLVQVKCMRTSTPRYFWALALMAKVRSLVLPPAPHVTSTNSGSSFAILSIRADLKGLISPKNYKLLVRLEWRLSLLHTNHG